MAVSLQAGGHRFDFVTVWREARSFDEVDAMLASALDVAPSAAVYAVPSGWHGDIMVNPAPTGT